MSWRKSEKSGTSWKTGVQFPATLSQTFVRHARFAGRCAKRSVSGIVAGVKTSIIAKKAFALNNIMRTLTPQSLFGPGNVFRLGQQLQGNPAGARVGSNSSTLFCVGL